MLNDEESDGRQDGKPHHREPDPELGQGLGVNETVHRLQQQEGGRSRDEGRLTESGQCLGLAVSEPVLGVRRH